MSDSSESEIGPFISVGAESFAVKRRLIAFVLLALFARMGVCGTSKSPPQCIGLSGLLLGLKTLDCFIFHLVYSEVSK